MTGDAGFTPGRQRLRRLRRIAWLGTARRTTPFSDRWGFDRGTPIDRYYIESFLARHRGDIRGRVLEMGDSRYIDRFGADITGCDVLDVDESNKRATIVADLARPDAFEEDGYDCFILVQTLQYVYDLAAAAQTAHRLVRPNGVVLITAPAVSRIARSAGPDGDFWRFTAASCRTLFETEFGAGAVDVQAFGNVLTGASFLLGLASEELTRRELDFVDPWFPVVVAARAVKRA
ncbi:MAG TPA: methyltransferase domain-containing protein [Gaiellaceae bacterium]|nr:methyltransferase domain-containing protein [Gaiellaceae bacterium]